MNIEFYQDPMRGSYLFAQLNLGGDMFLGHQLELTIMLSQTLYLTSCNETFPLSLFSKLPKGFRECVQVKDREPNAAFHVSCESFKDVQIS